jgi:uncharacterized protein (DUF952 family)
MPYIYHIASKEAWEQARSTGQYIVPSLKEEGFIHCSMEEQVPRVLERFYTDRRDLVLLCIDSGKLGSQLVYEWAPSMEATFPHVYGPINTDSVTEVRPIGLDKKHGEMA